jgi:hypothetical protein
MGSSVRIRPPWSSCFSTSTSAVFLPLTPWMDAGQIEAARGFHQIPGSAGLFMATWGYETADVENSVSGGTSMGPYGNGDGFYYPSSYTILTSVLEAKQRVRFGWLCKNFSGASLTWAVSAATSTS